MTAESIISSKLHRCQKLTHTMAMCTLLSLLLWAIPGSAYNFSKVNTDHVRAMVIDKNNMLWLAVKDTIYQYDGALTRPFYSVNTGNYSIYMLHLSDDDKLWFNNDNQIGYIDLKSGLPEVHWITENITNADPDKDFVGIYQDQKSRIWFNSFLGDVFQYYQGETRSFSLTDDKRCILKDYTVSKYTEDDEGRLWAVSGCGLYYFDETTEQFTQVNLPGSDLKNFIGVEHGPAGLIVMTSTGLYRFDFPSQTFEIVDCGLKVPPNQLSIADTAAISKTQIIVASRLGLFKCDFQSNSHEWLKINEEGQNEPLISKVDFNPGGDLWVRTRSGLYHSNIHDIRYERLHRDGPTHKQLISNFITSIYETSEDSLWIGTIDGLNHYQKSIQLMTHYTPAGDSSGSLLGKSIWSLSQDPSGQFLLIGTEKGLNLLELTTHEFIHRGNRPDWPPAQIKSRIWDMAWSDDILWMATVNKGLYRYDTTRKTLTHYKHNPDDPDSLPSNRLRSVHVDNDKNLWIGGRFGLYRFDPATEKFSQYSELMIVDIANLPDGSPLFASSYFLYYQENEDRVQPWTYLGNEISGGTLVNDGQNNLWYSLPVSVIAMIDQSGYLHRNPIPKLYNIEPILKSGVFGPSGNLYFGTVEGLYYFKPKQPRKIEPPKVLLTNVSTIDGNNIPYAALMSGRQDLSITLAPGDPGISINFTTIDYRWPRETMYKYRLVGFDSDFIQVNNTQQIAQYTNLAPGQYRFEVKATDARGAYSTPPTTMRVTVAPHLWQIRWVQAIAILSLLLAGYCYTRRRTRVLKQRAIELESQVSERTKEISELLMAKEQLIANVSHEFRTPLTLIQGPAGLIAQQSDDAELVKQANVIQRNSQRLLRMVEHLLMFSKPKESEDTLTSIEPNALLRIFAEPFILLAHKQQITLLMDVESDPAAIKLPAEALEKIVTNLLSNALKYSQAQDEIRLCSFHNEHSWQMTVTDTGIGMAADQLEHIFERFNRLSSAHHEKVSGAGLGLALVKELVDSYEGKITVTSELDKGSAFTVEFAKQSFEAQPQAASEQVNHQQLQLAVDSAEKVPDVSSDTTKNNPPSTTSVLIVEDNPDMCRYIESILSGDYQIFIAQDGQAGLEVAQKELPDLIISDVMMPKMDGFELCRHIKQALPTCHIPVILLTALSDVQDRISGYQNLADEYLNKPFNPQELTARVQNLLAIRSLLHQQLAEDKLLKKPMRENALNEKDQKFLQQVTLLIDDNYADSEFTAKQLYSQMAMSERLFQRKLKALTGRTPIDHIREKRLQQSAELLLQGHHVGVIADMVGFTSHAYFSSCFKARFGVTPREYAK